MQAEIEKVKKRREERALEKARHEEEMVSSLHNLLLEKLSLIYWRDNSFLTLDTHVSGWCLAVVGIC